MKKILLTALAAATLALTGCGLDCAEYCTKMDDCMDGKCDTGQCEDFCEMALDNDEVGFDGSGQCAIETSCADLENGACFPYGAVGRQWCSD